MTDPRGPGRTASDAPPAPVAVASLSVTDVWTTPGPRVWRAGAFVQDGDFYPVYRLGDLYSASPPALMRHTGEVHVRPHYADRHHLRAGPFTHADDFLDPRILRADRPPEYDTPGLRADELPAAFADAMNADLAELGRTLAGRGPGDWHHAVLCGGKDSLGALLLDWGGPVTVLSGEPNTPLVRRFVEGHGLPFEVRRLDDPPPDVHREVLANCCRVDLAHARWVTALREFVRDRDGRVVLWVGAMADALLTPKWGAYARYGLGRAEWAVVGRIPAAVRSLPVVGRWPNARLRAGFRRTLWHRGSMWQGAYLSLLRDLTGGLVLSPYHGPRMTAVQRRLDPAVVTRDLRHELAERLHGRPVDFPAENPSPPLSAARADLSDPARFLRAAEADGLRVRRL